MTSITIGETGPLEKDERGSSTAQSKNTLTKQLTIRPQNKASSSLCTGVIVPKGYLKYQRCRLPAHQMAHFSFGFIGDSGAHLKALENSGEFERVPMTRNSEGVCGSFRTCSCKASGVFTEHHTWAKPIKKSWSSV